MTDLVDQMFPPIHRKWALEFTDVSFWRPPMGDYDLPEDLAPPSPTLSARSDASGQTRLSRLRNFNLLSGSAPSPTAAAALVSAVSRTSTRTPNGHSRHTSASSSLASESTLTENERRRRREGKRRLSNASVPGMLEGFHLDDDDDDDEEDGDEEDDSGEDEVEDDEDDEEEEEDEEYEDNHEEDEYDELLATGEMDKVPFL